MSRRPHSDFMTTTEFAAEVGLAIRDYNSKLHRSLKGSPLTAWRDADVQATPVPERDVALTLLRRDEVAVTRQGVEINGVMYQGRATFSRIGETLEAGWLATRPDFIELFDPLAIPSERWLGRLEPLDQVSRKLSNEVRRVRDREIETVERAQRRAKELREELPQLRSGKTLEPDHRDRATTRPPKESPPADAARRQRVAGSGLLRPLPEDAR